MTDVSLAHGPICFLAHFAHVEMPSVMGSFLDLLHCVMLYFATCTNYSMCTGRTFCYRKMLIESSAE